MAYRFYIYARCAALISGLIVEHIKAALFGEGGAGHAGNQGVERADGFYVFARIIEMVQKGADAVEAGALFIIGFHHGPRGVAGVGVENP